MKKIIFILLSLIFITACKKVFIDPIPPSYIPDDSLINTIPDTYNYGSYSVKGYINNKDKLNLGSNIIIEGYIVDVYKCYCPPNVFCKPCWPNHIILSDFNVDIHKYDNQGYTENYQKLTRFMGKDIAMIFFISDKEIYDSLKVGDKISMLVEINKVNEQGLSPGALIFKSIAIP